MAFDNPGGAFGIPAAELRLGDHATVAQRFVAANADPAAPGARADDRSQLELFEPQGEGLTIAAALPVDQRGHVATERPRRHSVHIAVTSTADSQNLPDEMGEDHRCNKAAMIPAVVHDQAAFAALRRIIAGELAQAARAHVVEVNVSDLAITLLINVFPVFADPVGIADAGVLSDRLDHHAPSLIEAGLLID